MAFSLSFHGAARTVTGSCIHAQTGSSQILIDCGMQQESDRNAKNEVFDFDPAKIDAVILTHGHLDHSGRVPLLVKRGFSGPIYGHYATCEIAQIIWNDSIKHSPPDGPIYDEDDIAATINKCVPIAYNVPMQIKDSSFVLRDAGHVLGSAHVVFEADGKRVIFSGDIGAINTPIIRDPYRNWTDAADAVVIESTYGNRTHKDRNATIVEFENIIKRTVQSNGVLLIPAFAIGRTQEILFHLNKLIENKIIDPIPVLIDSPMANQITGIYRRYHDCYDSETCTQIINGDLPLEFDGLSFVSSSSESNSIKDLWPPFIVVAGSGMCNGGRILKHITRFAPYTSTSIVFVGWQGYGTLGRKLVDGAKQVFINGNQVQINAKIETLNGLSAHADQQGLIEWARSIPGRPKQWFVNHGEETQACSLAVALGAEFGAEAVAVEKGFQYNL